MTRRTVTTAPAGRSLAGGHRADGLLLVTVFCQKTHVSYLVIYRDTVVEPFKMFIFYVSFWQI